MSLSPTSSQTDLTGQTTAASTNAESGLAATAEAVPIMGDNMVQRVCALWAGAGHTLGFEAFSVEGDDFPSAENNLVSMAAEMLDLSPDGERVLEILVGTTFAPGCALLGQRFAAAMGYTAALHIAVVDAAAATMGLGVGLGTAAGGPGCELVAQGGVQTKGDIMRLSPAILRFLLKGGVPSALAPFEVPRRTPPAMVAAFVDNREPTLRLVERALNARRPLLMSGPSGFGGVELLETLAARRGLGLRVTDLSAVFDLDKGLPTDLATQLHCESRLFPSIWLLVGLERSDRTFTDKPLAMARLLDRLYGIDRPVVLLHQGPMPPEMAAAVAALGGIAHVQIEAAAYEERTLAWQTALRAGTVPETEISGLVDHVAHLSLGIPQIANATSHALQMTADAAARKWAKGAPPPSLKPTLTDLSLAANTAMTSRLRRYGSRVSTRATWDDLVLHEDVLSDIKDLSRFSRLRRKLFDDYGFGDSLSYGRTMSALFSGPSGTGKTMVAGLIAKDLGVELYRVDLSRVVSKYIGETEERLGMLFSEATQVGAALLFDEADSLFGARTEIKSSNDRYANLEVNYLLQRLEDFDGVVILTTNFATSIDEAFLRRLRFRVEFPLPAESERARMWQVMLPDRLPVDEDDLDMEWMGKAFELSGGHIRNALLRAGMLAADADQPLSMRMLYDAAATEYRELGKLPQPYPYDDDDDW